MLRLARYASTSRLLKKPNFNVKSIIENASGYRESIVRRGNQRALESLDFLVSSRSEYRALTAQVDSLRNERNTVSLLFGKTRPSPEVAARLGEIKDQLKQLGEAHSRLEADISTAADKLPNLLDVSVPENPDEGEVVEYINGESQQSIEAWRPASGVYDHKTIGERLGLWDFATASLVTGSSWYYLLGDGALLEQALIQYALTKARQQGYRVITPPTLVKSEFVDACGFKPKDKNDENHVYDVEGHDVSLTGTAEIALGAFHHSQTLSHTELPLKYVGLLRAFRAEAGARGKDTKGLYRVHEFNKVELFHFTTGEAAAAELEQLRQLQTDIITELGLKAKMINMPTTDLGAPAMKKYDCEAWMPGRGSWGELTSSSNCGEYQSRRLGIRYKPSLGEKPQYVATLNGTCVAVPRVLVAIVEQNYDPGSDSVVIPEVLRPFMGGQTTISKQ